MYEVENDENEFESIQEIVYGDSVDSNMNIEAMVRLAHQRASQANLEKGNDI